MDIVDSQLTPVCCVDVQLIRINPWVVGLDDLDEWKVFREFVHALAAKVKVVQLYGISVRELAEFKDGRSQITNRKAKRLNKGWQKSGVDARLNYVYIKSFVNWLDIWKRRQAGSQRDFPGSHVRN